MWYAPSRMEIQGRILRYVRCVLSVVRSQLNSIEYPISQTHNQLYKILKTYQSKSVN